MRLIQLIALTILISACSAKPQPPDVHIECALVAVEGLSPYLYCKDIVTGKQIGRAHV